MIINSVVAQAINKAIKEIRVEHLIRRLRDGAWETYFTMLLADKLEDELEAIGEENKVRLEYTPGGRRTDLYFKLNSRNVYVEAKHVNPSWFCEKKAGITKSKITDRIVPDLATLSGEVREPGIEKNVACFLIWFPTFENIENLKWADAKDLDWKHHPIPSAIKRKRLYRGKHSAQSKKVKEEFKSILCSHELTNKFYLHFASPCRTDSDETDRNSQVSLASGYCSLNASLICDLFSNDIKLGNFAQLTTVKPFRNATVSKHPFSPPLTSHKLKRNSPHLY